MHHALDVRFQLRRFMQAINRTWPHPGHRLHNMGEGAKNPVHFSSCLYDFTPRDPAPDLVILEFGVNGVPNDWEELNRRVTSTRTWGGRWSDGIQRPEDEPGGGPAVLNVLTYNFCRADDGSNGAEAGFSYADCGTRLRATGLDPASSPHARAGHELRNASGDLRDAVTRFSLATGAAAVSALSAIAPLMNARRYPYWPPGLITTDGIHGEMHRLKAPPPESREACCVHLRPYAEETEGDTTGSSGVRYCASPPAMREVFRRHEWGSPWTSDDVDPDADADDFDNIEMSFYTIALADMMLFPIFRARSRPRSAVLNDASWEKREPQQPPPLAGPGGKRTRGDALRCLRWDVSEHATQAMAVIKENAHRRPPDVRPEHDRVPERYLGGGSELAGKWPGGDPDAPHAKGWIFVEHPVDGPPSVRELYKHGLVSVRPGDYLVIEVDASSIGADAGEAEVSFLTSYEHMGHARVTCVDGCRCKPQVLDGRSEKKSSETRHVSFELRDGGDLAKCRVRIENVAFEKEPGSGRNGTAVAEHKFKLFSMRLFAYVPTGDHNQRVRDHNQMQIKGVPVLVGRG